MDEEVESLKASEMSEAPDEDRVDREVTETIHRWSKVAKLEVERRGLHRLGLDEKFKYCFLLVASFSRALSADCPESALYFLMIISQVTLQYGLHEYETIDENFEAESRRLKNVLDDLVESEPELRSRIRAQVEENLRNRVEPIYFVARDGERVDLKQSKVVPADAFRVVEVKGDGHCAFRSIAQSVSNGTLSKSRETQMALRLRARAASLLERVKDTQHDCGMMVSQVLITEDFIRKNGFDGYVEQMKAGCFAGEFELLLLARDLGLVINVFLDKGNQYVSAGTYGTEGKMVFIRFTQAERESGNHYDALIPRANHQSL